jgi:hypothetical protein
VKLEKANVVFDIGHLVLNGDMPFFLGDTDLLASGLSNWNVKGETRPCAPTGRDVSY